MTPIPIILITGFLGAGKTTFINELLGSYPDRKISLILNEFGAIKLESKFITVRGVGMVSELSGGCLCCVASVDLPRVIRYTLEQAPETEYLVIEASGLSDPDPVRATLTSPGLADLVRLDTVVAIVDADNFVSTARMHPLVMSQIAEADYAVIAKSAGHSPAELEALVARVSTIGTGTRTFLWDTQFDPGFVLDPPLHPRESRPTSKHTHEEHFDEYWYQSDRYHDPDQLTEILRSLPDNILRVKGFADSHVGERVLIQKVGHHVDVRGGTYDGTAPHCAFLILGTLLDKAALQTALASTEISR
jgi:G3E family GTPase